MIMTSSFRGSFVLTLILSITIFQFTNAEDSPSVAACKSASRSNLKKLHKALSACNNDMKESLGDKQHEKMGCVVKCVLTKEKLIKENGMADDAMIKAGAVGRVTAEKEAKLAELFVECNKKFGDKLDQNDPFCIGHGELGVCIQHSITDSCV